MAAGAPQADRGIGLAGLDHGADDVVAEPARPMKEQGPPTPAVSDPDHPETGPAHPGPAAVELPAAIRDAILEHARAEYPNEACGIVVGDRPADHGGRATRWEPTRNAVASPYRYEVHPEDLLRLTLTTEDADEIFWAIVHSHVRSPARPSPTDIGAARYPESLYVLVSLSEAEADPTTGEPSLRAWRIVDGAIHEVGLRIER